MAVLTAQVIASLLQMHGPDATIQSDHQGIDALIGDIRGRMSRTGADLSEGDAVGATKVYFRRGGFRRGGSAFRRGGFVKGY